MRRSGARRSRARPSLARSRSVTAVAELDYWFPDGFHTVVLLATHVIRATTSLRLALANVKGAIACASSIIVGPVDDLPPEDRLIAARVDLKLGDARSAKEAIETLRDHGIGPRLTVHALRIEELTGRELDVLRRLASSTNLDIEAGM